MGQQIIKQPDGLFAVFSSITDTIHLYDATADEVVDYFVEQQAESTRRQVGAVLGHVAAGEPRKAYYQFVKTWAEALAADEAHGGDAWRELAGRTVGS